MKRTALVLLAVPFALLTVAPAYAGGGCFPGGPAALAETRTVVIDHACFGTGATHVAAGAAVTWRNASDFAHNISGPGVEFAELPAGAVHTVTFATPGLYPYACTIHPGMSGVVVVGPAAALTPPVEKSSSGLGTGWLAAGAVAIAAVAALGIARRARVDAAGPG
ncbi:MAG: hypothetical protein QOE45_2039 [Frankiaceae bacterium]|jgi:plastocyanin|nr:hypothetical protein [Frankiaceae bacterium]